MSGMEKGGEKKDSVKPRTYYEELAELGLLDEMLKTRFEFNYRNDSLFRNKMHEILYDFSPKPVTSIEKLNLEYICEGLSFFLEYTKEYLVNMDFIELLDDKEINEMRRKFARRKQELEES